MEASTEPDPNKSFEYFFFVVVNIYKTANSMFVFEKCEQIQI